GQLTRSDAILGTPAFMAPEQAQSGGIDDRCDLFSLGAVLYRMLSGEMPLKGQDLFSIRVALATPTPRPIQELNPALQPGLAALVMKLLEKAPNQRPASASAVAVALAAFEGGGERFQDKLGGHTPPTDQGPARSIPPPREPGSTRTD